MGWDALNCMYFAEKRGRWENHVINHMSPIKSRIFLNWLMIMYLLKKGSAPWKWFVAFLRNTLLRCHLQRLRHAITFNPYITRANWNISFLLPQAEVTLLRLRMFQLLSWQNRKFLVPVSYQVRCSTHQIKLLHIAICQCIRGLQYCKKLGWVLSYSCILIWNSLSYMFRPTY
jgi:hypothetical protein